MEIVDVVGFEGLYKVSSDGDIYTFSNRNGKYNYALKQSLDKDGYKYVKLYKNGKYYHSRVHRIVAEAFIPNPYKKPVVNHIDFNRANNRISNLEWVSVKENARHSCEANRHVGRSSAEVVSIDKDGNKKVYSSITQAEKETGALVTNIIKVCKGLRPFACGYRWFYKNEVIIEEVEKTEV